MNPPIFLALFGQRPQAITMALDGLLPRYPYTQVGLLHTTLVTAELQTAYEQLREVLRTDFPDLRVVSHELRQSDGAALTDIVDAHTAEAYFAAVVVILREYRIQAVPLHLLVAGGRKAMSIYATLAATLLFGEQDRLWTVLSSVELMTTAAFRIPAGRRAEVQLVNLPFQPSRLLPGSLAHKSLDELLHPVHSPRERFLQDLSPEEHSLVELLRQQPYATNEEIGVSLNKSAKTIENQFRSVYAKLATYFEVEVTVARKRQVLLDVLQGRV
jgi:CRISPR-associated protein Csx14